MVNDPHWAVLCTVLGVPETSNLEEVVAAAELLRAEAEIQLVGIQTAGAWAARATPVVNAAEVVYHELIALGNYQPGEAAISSVRSDRWPPEADLMLAMDKFLGVKVVAAE